MTLRIYSTIPSDLEHSNIQQIGREKRAWQQRPRNKSNSSKKRVEAVQHNTKKVQRVSATIRGRSLCKKK